MQEKDESLTSDQLQQMTKSLGTENAPTNRFAKGELQE